MKNQKNTDVSRQRYNVSLPRNNGNSYTNGFQDRARVFCYFFKLNEIKDLKVLLKRKSSNVDSSTGRPRGGGRELYN